MVQHMTIIQVAAKIAQLDVVHAINMVFAEAVLMASICTLVLVELLVLMGHSLMTMVSTNNVLLARKSVKLAQV